MKTLIRMTLAAGVALALLESGAALASTPELFLTAPSRLPKTEIAEQFIKNSLGRYSLTKSDVSEMALNPSTYVTKHNGVTHVFFDQHINGIPVYNAVFQVNVMPDGRVLNATSSFVPEAHDSVLATTPSLALENIIEKAAADLGVVGFRAVPETSGLWNGPAYKGGELSAEPIVPKLVYQQRDGRLHLTWQFVVDRVSRESKYLDLRYDAVTGELVASDNYTADIGADTHAAAYHAEYRVSPLGQESPGHPGVGHAIVTDPHHEVASPYGWHESRNVDQQTTEPQYLVTRGNNVRAQWDLTASNINNDSARPLGVWDADTGTLSFDFPWIEEEEPDTETNRVAATVNLFYWNNIIHDVLYLYGFDEPSGNFQFNNYGNGGSQNDGVIADALDGSQLATPNTNNANFSTPVDGGSGRMQMYRWTSPGGLLITSPEEITLTPPVPGDWGWQGGITEVSGELVIVDAPGTPATGSGILGCNAPLNNAADVAGKIAVIQRGVCNFSLKAYVAQQAGAIGVIIFNNDGTNATAGMAAGDYGASVTIPVVGIVGNLDGDDIVSMIQQGPVEATLKKKLAADRDSDFDAGIMAHEYAHGLSYRLTGPRTQNCLSGDEQQGEGWSDFIALHLTMTDAVCSEPRGVGTYAQFEPVDGLGIRRYPYTPDMSINPFTYADVADTTNAVPHGVGSIWATMVWDMSCKLMDRYGYDPDVYSRGGGNGMSMQLVMDGLKMQGCYPQFVQSRDGILAADAAWAAADENYLTNKCIIWNVFARRGVGEGASAGTYNSRLDQTPSFVVPEECTSFDVAVSASAGGTISQAGTVVTADYEEVLTFDVTPDAGAVLLSVEGCEGQLVGNQFVTKPIVRDCAVHAEFWVLPTEPEIFKDGFETAE